MWTKGRASRAEEESTQRSYVHAELGGGDQVTWCISQELAGLQHSDQHERYKIQNPGVDVKFIQIGSLNITTD